MENENEDQGKAERVLMQCQSAQILSTINHAAGMEVFAWNEIRGTAGFPDLKEHELAARIKVRNRRNKENAGHEQNPFDNQ